MSATAKQERAKASTKAAPAFVPRVLDLQAGAFYLSIGVWTLRELIWAGKIPTVKIPRPDGEPMNRVLIRREDLDKFVDGLEIDQEVDG